MEGPPPPAPPPQNMRSSVSMFIEDSRITAVANSNAGAGQVPPSPYYSVTSFSSTSGTQGQGQARRGGWPGLRPAFSPLPPSQSQPPPRGRVRACSSSPVRFPQAGSSSNLGRGGSTGREIIHNIIREGVEVMEEVVPPRLRQQQQQPPPPPSTVRRRATLSVEPVISVGLGLPPQGPRRDDRAYTTVNLTLRSPTSVSPGGSDLGGVKVLNTVVDMEAGGTTFRHVHSSTGGEGHPPTNLTYSTFSNSRDGFEAQVQIHFGPGGGTFTASRRRAHAQHQISVRQMNSDLLSAQGERKDKLRSAIQDRRCLLANLQTEIVQLRSQLQLRTPFTELERLKKENQRLRIQCDFMAREVDLYQNGSVPLGETDEEFYQGINPGQSIDALFGITNNRRKVVNRPSPNQNQPPPRPPPPKFLQSPTTPSQAGGGGGDVGDEEGEWRCLMCTFQNNRDLGYCEQCQMVRVKQQQPQNRGEQNIRIRVVRRQPGQNRQQRRVIHSWVM